MVSQKFHLLRFNFVVAADLKRALHSSVLLGSGGLFTKSSFDDFLQHHQPKA
jgi:hypothetical protein